MIWSIGQQAMLEAMGLQVMVRAPAGVPVAPVTALPDRLGPAAPSAMAAPFPEAPAGGHVTGDHAALARALLRAAGGGDLAGLADDLARLSREPALKRALWPRLRTLRRSH